MLIFKAGRLFRKIIYFSRWEKTKICLHWDKWIQKKYFKNTLLILKKNKIWGTKERKKERKKERERKKSKMKREKKRDFWWTIGTLLWNKDEIKLKNKRKK